MSDQDTHKKLVHRIHRASVPVAPVPTGEHFRIKNPALKEYPPVAILFDIYGTLFISASGDISLAKEQPDCQNEDDRRINEYNTGFSFAQLREKFIDEVGHEHSRLKNTGIDYPEIRVEELWARILALDPDADMEKIALFSLDFELAVNPVYPMPGLADTLSLLLSRGIPAGIISNAQFFTPLLFEAFLDTPWEAAGFTPELCFLSCDYHRAKPGIFLFEKAAEALNILGIDVHRTLYVGNDMRNDIMTAQKAGFYTALFAGDRRSLRWRTGDKDCNNVRPDAVLSSLRDLEILFDQNKSH